MVHGLPPTSKMSLCSFPFGPGNAVCRPPFSLMTTTHGALGMPRQWAWSPQSPRPNIKSETIFFFCFRLPFKSHDLVLFPCLMMSVFHDFKRNTCFFSRNFEKKKKSAWRKIKIIKLILPPNGNIYKDFFMHLLWVVLQVIRLCECYKTEMMPNI